MEHYVHHVPGRIRIKNPALRKNHQKLSNLQEKLGSFDGVVKSAVNPTTGSLTINYDPARTHGNAILAHLKDHGLLQVTATIRKAEDAVVYAVGNVGSSVSGVGAKVGKAVTGMVLEKILERGATMLIAALL